MWIVVDREKREIKTPRKFLPLLLALQVATSGVTGVTHNPQQQILLAPQQLFQQPPLLSQQQGLFQQPGVLAGQLQQGGAVMPTAVGLHGNTSQGQVFGAFFLMFSFYSNCVCVLRPSALYVSIRVLGTMCNVHTL